MSSRRLLTSTALLALVILPSPGQADPVQITSGFLVAEGASDLADFRFVGTNFEATGSTEPGAVGPEITCFPCAAGDAISLNTNYGGTIGDGTATIGGTSYEHVTFGGQLMFRSSPVTAPPTPGAFIVTQPFTFSGTLVGFLNYNTTNEQKVFTQALTGSGLVTAAFEATPNVGTPLFTFDSVRYEFASDAAVPEPATMLLIGSGLAAAGVRKRLRKRQED
jgi:PEP-CTERM motif-containing protein